MNIPFSLSDIREMVKEMGSPRYKRQKAEAKAAAEVKERDRFRLRSLIETSSDWKPYKSEVEQEILSAKDKIIEPPLPSKARMFLCGYVQGLNFLMTLEQLSKTKAAGMLDDEV